MTGMELFQYYFESILLPTPQPLVSIMHQIRSLCLPGFHNYTKPYLFFVTFCHREHREHRDVFSAPNSSLCALCELCELCGSYMKFLIILTE
jgi:hypothetical protein